ncbi:MAG TPA: hypothetical protein VNY84_13050, partial [Acidimicrobiales bacterium]|nr:hypothetical protein [Acidimicrobiales bacterium]
GHTYVMGGFDGTHTAADVLQTDDGTSFRVVTQLPVPVRYPGIAVSGSTIYLFGGQVGSGQTADIQAIDVASGTARIVGTLPQALSEATAWTQQGQVFLAGGRVGSTIVRTIWRFDPAGGQAVAVASLPRPTADAPVAVIGTDAFLFGGEGPSRLNGIVRVSLQ